MAIVLKHLKGFNSISRGSVRAHPRIPSQLIYVSGSQVIIAQEDVHAPQCLLRGHDDRITAFALSASGSLVATGQGGQNSDVVIWDTASASARSRFQEHDMEVVSLAFSPDERLLLTVGHEKDQKLYVLDTSTGKIVGKQVMEYNKRVCASAFGAFQANLYTFATATTDGDLNIWTIDPYTGLISGHKVVTGTVRRYWTSLVFGADGQWLYGGTTSGDVVMVNVLRRAVQMTHPACANGVGAMTLSSNGRLLVGGGDGTITLFTSDHMWREIRPFVSVPGSITSLSPNCDGSALIVGTAQGGVYRVASGSISVATLERSHSAPVRGVSFSPGSCDSVATCSDDGTVSIWGMAPANWGYAQLGRVEGGNAGAALCVALTHDSVVSGWADGFLRCHSRGQAGPGGVLAQSWVIPGAHSLAHSVGVTAVKMANRGQFAATGGAGGELRVWDVRSREMVSHMKLHTAAITDLSVLSDDAHLVAASEDRSWSIWDLHQERSRASWRTPSLIRGMALSPDQVTVVTASQDRQLTFFDIRAPEPVRVVPLAHAGEVGAVAIDPSGRFLLSGGADAVIKMWELRSGALITETVGHTSGVTKMAFAPVAAAPGPVQMVSAGLDGVVGMWEVAV
mmetsp:Transcript_4915/g.10559  ORF Transcript_4915/g.10559 Transcript_4915/m.10559 type:complete len:624 (+) Transcript_4915:105-1976(+)|eukprot:CAMPEP_0202919054 /NCGR_PEP_ID=MMETSP1392-20130828/74925_1 /ASSEMBLY_ACC=CAM_ASM_000868 /TAXON_ID=225041 /ORGANISM="Chlamydomonas chlamydogama, Strain SAG 11-48b" /LENGTH=623 /DNA_ID=CAMNT_0049612273 /DNA_START=49 /DNA_END=1920 /DNA_ORIENTATION=+